MRAAVAHTTGEITAAVDDLRTGTTYVYDPADREQTASIMKVDILETLLREAMRSGTPLNEEQSELAAGMIENSNDQYAQELWDSEGGAASVAGYDANAGMKDTVPNDDGYWGESTTSAIDQIALLRELVVPGGLLDAPSRDYELRLMKNVEPDQTWGVSGGVPNGVSVALKDGWVPLTSDSNWQINSIGRIRGDGRWYLIAVLTAHDPSMGDGIDTIERISAAVWSDLRSG